MFKLDGRLYGIAAATKVRIHMAIDIQPKLIEGLANIATVLIGFVDGVPQLYHRLVISSHGHNEYQ